MNDPGRKISESMISHGLVGPQAETYGGSSAIGRVGRGYEAADQQSDRPVGGKFGEASLRAVSPEMLHGQSAERRIAQSQGKEQYCHD